MRIFILCFLFWANTAYAQSYPDFQNTTVNDYADLLNPTDEAALSSQLRELRQKTGVEMTVLTLKSRSDYAPNQTLEQFATGLFNNWGIGDSTRNDGVLVMILRNDRAMRIELGAGYGRQWDKVAQRVVDHKFLPAFKDNNYPRGIMTGSNAVIEDIVMPFHNDDPAPTNTFSDRPDLWIFGGIAAIMALFAGRGPISDGMARFRKCPKCGQKTLRQTRRTTRQASTSMTGAGVRRVYCTNCDHSEETTYIISQRSSGSSGGFGGGRSGGGGASGRW